MNINKDTKQQLQKPLYKWTVHDLLLLIKCKVLLANVLPVLTSFLLALNILREGFLDYWMEFIFVLLGSTLVMGGALVLNNWYDVDIDTIMERTQKRPTVTGNVPLQTVLNLGIGFTIAGFIFLLMVNMKTTLFAFIGWFTYVFLYTMWSKRRYAFNTLIGSLSGAVTPLMGWAAVGSILHKIPLALFLLLFIWQMPHTYAIAIKKFQEYAEAKVAMLPVVSGITKTKYHMVFYIACLLPIPFLLASFGKVFVIVTFVFTMGWLILALSGFLVKDQWKWAHWNFLYSVNYLMIIFIYMTILTLCFKVK
ncbi:protoheme IX farnesyltransferase [Niallia circulans]|uniref:heme o synthase n=1 Tax=Niallia circulans TaxID=1397 RepID=UPI00201E2F69|nr:heme o synthase [Niallia circulans]UQZ75283.1 protoheme IX farnesyltransferase [Niallia circulans]